MNWLDTAGIENASAAYQSAVAAMQTRALPGYAGRTAPRLVHRATGTPAQPLFSPARQVANQQRRLITAVRMGVPR